VDLLHWTAADYQHQWNAGIARLVNGAPSTALMSAYRGRGDDAHVMWALWRDETHVYIQEHAVLPADLDAPFDPAAPYGHVGTRVPAAENGLPIPEWHVKIEHLRAAQLGMRLP
jgi:CdiI N-terminal domain